MEGVWDTLTNLGRRADFWCSERCRAMVLFHASHGLGCNGVQDP